MKYKDWLKDWLEHYVKPTVKDKTYTRYAEVVRLHLIPALGEYELSDLKPIVLQRYVTELTQSGNLKTGKGLSANSVNGILIVIRGSLTTAHNIGLTDELIVGKIKRPRNEEKAVECFTVSEQKQIEQAVFADKRDKMIGVVLCLYTGLRLGELLALEWTDVDLSRGELTVSKSCHDGKDENGNYCRITGAPKTNSSKRTIPIPKQLIPHLREVKKRSVCDHVIANGNKPVTVRSYQRSFDLLQQKIKIPHHGFHALRHTFATRAIECGMDVKSLSEILGHKDPTITLKRYVHSLMEHKREYMNRLGKML